MVRLVAPKGLGDAVYLRAIVLHLIGRGEKVAVSTEWPQALDGLGVEFRSRADVDSTYRPAGFSLHHKLAGLHEGYAGLDQFEICCRRAGLDEEPVTLQIQWAVKNKWLCKKVRSDAAGRPILIYQPRKRQGQSDLTPKLEAFDEWLDAHKEFYRVRVGNKSFINADESRDCDLNLVGATLVSDVFDLATVADLFFSEPSYLGMLAEAIDKPSVWMLSRDTVNQDDWNHLTPQRMFHKPHLSRAVYDS